MLPEILAFLFFLFFRLYNLTIIPIFADEAIYLHWAQLAWHDASQRFISLSDGKPPLHTWLLIPFLKIFKDPLLGGRLLSVSSGFFSFLGLGLISRKLFAKNMARIVLFLTSFCPFLVFYDRLALADSLLTAFGIWSFYFTYSLLKNPDLGKIFLLGFCWGGALLTKQPGIYFIFLSPFLFFLFVKKKFLREILKMRKSFIAWLFSLFIAVLTSNIVKLSPLSHLLSVRSYDYILGKREFLQNPFLLFWGNLKAIFYWVAAYQRIIPGLIFLCGLILMVIKEKNKALVFSLWLFCPILISAAIGKIIFPRYFVFIQPWLNIFLAYGLDFFISFFYKLSKKRIILPIFYFFGFLPWFWFSILLVFAPVKAPLIEREQNQYLTSWSAGYGIKEISFWLKEHHPQEEVYVATEGFFGTLPNGLDVYLDLPNIKIFGIGQPIHQIPQEVLKLAEKSPTYLVVNSTRSGNFFTQAELIKEYPKPKFPFLEEKLLFYKIKAQ